MSTVRQQKLAEAIVENTQADKPLNKQELVASVGYSAASADKKSAEIFESKGVQEELLKRGFDPEAAKSVVAEILHAGENDTVKLKAADMIFKVHGNYAAEKHVNLNVEVEANEEIKKAATLLNDLYRTGSIGSDGATTGALGNQTPD